MSQTGQQKEDTFVDKKNNTTHPCKTDDKLKVNISKQLAVYFAKVVSLLFINFSSTIKIFGLNYLNGSSYILKLYDITFH